MPTPRLLSADVAAIRELYAAGGVSQSVLSERFGVSQSTISSAIRCDGDPRVREQAELRARGLKRCPKCLEVKSREDGFYSNPSIAGGLQPYCCECDVALNVERGQENHESRDERFRRWREANPDRVRANGRMAASARRARIRDAFVEHVDPQVVFERDEGVCGICGESVERDWFDVDHVIPLALGGEHSYENSQVAHPSCNRAKGRAIGLAAQAA